MPKLKTKSCLKGKVKFTASGKAKVSRSNCHHFKTKKTKRANTANRKANYLKSCFMKAIKRFTPYGA